MSSLFHVNVALIFIVYAASCACAITFPDQYTPAADRYRRLFNLMAVNEDEVASWKLEETVEWALKQYNSRVAHRFEGT